MQKRKAMLIIIAVLLLIVLSVTLGIAFAKVMLNKKLREIEQVATTQVVELNDDMNEEPQDELPPTETEEATTPKVAKEGLFSSLGLTLPKPTETTDSSDSTPTTSKPTTPKPTTPKPTTPKPTTPKPTTPKPTTPPATEPTTPKPTTPPATEPTTPPTTQPSVPTVTEPPASSVPPSGVDNPGEFIEGDVELEDNPFD